MHFGFEDQNILIGSQIINTTVINQLLSSLQLLQYLINTTV